MPHDTLAAQRYDKLHEASYTRRTWKCVRTKCVRVCVQTSARATRKEQGARSEAGNRHVSPRASVRVGGAEPELQQRAVAAAGAGARLLRLAQLDAGALQAALPQPRRL